MKTKCEPGDKLKFPDGTEYLFLGYFDDQAVIIDRSGENPKTHIVCKCCTPKLAELINNE